jgi:flagellar basal body-associated protein FliL
MTDAWIALIVVGVLIIVGLVLYLVMRRRPDSMNAVLIPVFPPNPHPNGYNPADFNASLPQPSLNPTTHTLEPNAHNLMPNAHNLEPNAHNLMPNAHNLLPGVTTKDLSEAFAPAF